MTEGLYIPVLVEWKIKSGTVIKAIGNSDQIRFTTPIDLIPGDRVAVRKTDNQPMSIYRRRGVVWKKEE
jgi:hypothetical protein